MRTHLGVVLAATILVASACGGDVTGPKSYESIAGSYSGAMVGLSQGVALSATFSLTITQTGGSAGGSWALQGTLTDGVEVVDVQGTGTLSGSVAIGNNPSVNFTIKTGACPDYQAYFSGSYDSANRRLTVSGPISFFATNSCSVALTYQTTIILNR